MNDEDFLERDARARRQANKFFRELHHDQRTASRSSITSAFSARVFADIAE